VNTYTAVIISSLHTSQRRESRHPWPKPAGYARVWCPSLTLYEDVTHRQAADSHQSSHDTHDSGQGSIDPRSDKRWLHRASLFTSNVDTGLKQPFYRLGIPTPVNFDPPMFSMACPKSKFCVFATLFSLLRKLHIMV